ncbi:MAG: cyanophycin synthetase [Scytolyngbya sp. HA4215-MV1]|nr:cyanophycin synthetase [Scytolyngbya sp. HA4215-MV1]
MAINTDIEITRVNARKTDAFDIFNFRYYQGPNFYLEKAAIVFDLTVTENSTPLLLQQYADQIADYYPHIREQSWDSYAALFAQTVAEVSNLGMGLQLDRWSLHPQSHQCTRIAVQSLHTRVSRSVVYSVWDWFEAMTQKEKFYLDDQVKMLQKNFRDSVYGGPTVYALLKTAHQLDIPAFYLWDEGLMQYGYGKKQVRGIATTFDRDSHLDSDFTTRKDDCKSFLACLGFPVPKGEVVYSLSEALAVARRIGYPIAIKPVVGHKGIGVTADIHDADELMQAVERAIQAIPPTEPLRIIVERSIPGKDYRLLCVNGRFVAATERRPASVTGDGKSTIQELIDRENRSPDRSDTPTSPLGKIQCDDAMERYLEEQRLSLDRVLERGHTVFLRKVANLSSGGFSIDATQIVHPDTIILVQDIAQHFRLTCLGIDVITADLSQSWKESHFGILEINAAPGIFMHLRPAIGESVDIASHILKTFFTAGQDARIPILTFNRVSVSELLEMIDHILLKYPNWTIGSVCREGVFINRSQKEKHPDYNTNVQNLLRNPSLDLLIVEYQETAIDHDGMFYSGSDLVLLDNPTEVEMILMRDVVETSTVVVRKADKISVHRHGLVEQYQLEAEEPINRVYLKEIATVLSGLPE